MRRQSCESMQLRVRCGAARGLALVPEGFHIVYCDRFIRSQLSSPRLTWPRYNLSAARTPTRGGHTPPLLSSTRASAPEESCHSCKKCRQSSRGGHVRTTQISCNFRFKILLNFRLKGLSSPVSKVKTKRRGLLQSACGLELADGLGQLLLFLFFLSITLEPRLE